MRRTTSVLLIAAALAGFGITRPATADEFVVTGKIQVPTATVARAERCRNSLVPDQQGVVGWTITGITPGNAFTLKAYDTSGVQDFEIAFYDKLAACQDSAVGLAHTNVSGDEQGVVPPGATVAIVNLHNGTPGAEFTYRESPIPTPAPRSGPKPLTVVAVIDGGFNPYHYDFLGSQHPFNLDADSTNDVDFNADPADLISGYPGAAPLQVTLPTSPDEDISDRRYGKTPDDLLAETPKGVDEDVWDTLEVSAPDAVKMYRFPGTKVIGAVNFRNGDETEDFLYGEPEFFGDNESHGTRSAASAAGNIHGTCPECVFVLVNNSSPEALAWVAAQPWIDVVTNSYGHSVVGSKVAGAVRDNIYFGSPIEATKAASERGQTVVFSAGNGLANAFDVPMFTYWSSEKGPDWMVTVGAVDPRADQQYSGAGKPVDVSSYGVLYPSTGGTTANGVGEHSGTSNAAPVVAGTIASVIQRGREALGDLTEGNAGGVVAEGEPVACGDANPDCPLGDGVLTSKEARDTVFNNVLPSRAGVAADTVWPSTEYNYYYQGHGVVKGRMTQRGYDLEQFQFTSFLTGDAASFTRPAGEQNWMVVDSKCRQKLWGSWTGGYFTGTTPELSPTADPIADKFNAICSQTPDKAFADFAPIGSQLGG